MERSAARRPPLSLVVTTFNNVTTIENCISSAPFADEVLVLDSFSTDGTDRVAERLGARVVREPFRGYGPQKQRAIDLARHDRVLLLDADEALTPQLADEIRAVLQQPATDFGPFRLRREEWLYWRWPARGTGLTDHLRLFDRRRVSMGTHPVHAAPECAEPATVLRGRLRHYGHADLAGQLRRIDSYTNSAAAGSRDPAASSAVRMLLAPTAAFIREYLFRRQFLNGWAGYLAARLAAFHAFLRHAKRLEARRQRRAGLPEADRDSE